MTKVISAFPEGDDDVDEPEPPRRARVQAVEPPAAAAAVAVERPDGIEPVRGEAANRGEQVAVEVGPGGGLLALTFTERSKRHGPEHLAATILTLVGEATAHANAKTRHLLATHVGAVSDADLDALGIGNDPELAAHAELTTPDTWMR